MSRILLVIGALAAAVMFWIVADLAGAAHAESGRIILVCDQHHVDKDGSQLGGNFTTTLIVDLNHAMIGAEDPPNIPATISETEITLGNSQQHETINRITGELFDFSASEQRIVFRGQCRRGAPQF